VVVDFSGRPQVRILEARNWGSDFCEKLEISAPNTAQPGSPSKKHPNKKLRADRSKPWETKRVREGVKNKNGRWTVGAQWPPLPYGWVYFWYGRYTCEPPIFRPRVRVLVSHTWSGVMALPTASVGRLDDLLVIKDRLTSGQVADIKQHLLSNKTLPSTFFSDIASLRNRRSHVVLSRHRATLASVLLVLRASSYLRVFVRVVATNDVKRTLRPKQNWNRKISTEAGTQGQE